MVATLYAASMSIQDYHALQEYQKIAPSLGLERLDPEVARHISKRYKNLKAELPREQFVQLGRALGWAAIGLGKERVDIEDLEARVELEQYRPYYRLANDRIHATPNPA
jgi:hypothetical protein